MPEDTNEQSTPSILDHLSADDAEALRSITTPAETQAEEKTEEVSPETAAAETSPEQAEDTQEGITEEEKINEEEVAKTPGLAKVLKRVDKLTARLTDAEKAAQAAQETVKARDAEIERMRQQGASQPRTEQAATELDNIWDVATIQAKQEEAERIADWAELHPDGAEAPDGKGGKSEFDAEKMREIRANAKASAKAAAKRVEFVKQVLVTEQELSKSLPTWFAKDHDDHKALNDALNDLPELARRTDGTLRAIVYALGKRELNSRLQKQAAEKSPDAAKPPAEEKTPVTKVAVAGAKLPPPVPKMAGVTKPQTGKVGQEVKAREALLDSSGTVDDLEAYFAKAG